MENLENIIKQWQLHPVADHFTIALLVVALLVDLAALLFAQRLWLRYSALMLMIIGAACAAASYATGDLEADRIGQQVVGPAKIVLANHAWWGFFLMCAFGVLALWRILIQAFTFMDATRQIYLALAVVAVGFLLYQGRLGGELVYTYGVGTGPMAAAPLKSPAPAYAQPAESASPSAPTSIPTVYVPPPTSSETPSSAPTPQSSAAPSGSSSPAPSAEASPKPSV